MATSRSFLSIVQNIMRGYGRLFCSVGLWLAASLVAVASSAAVVWPLWALATKRRGAFNAIVLCAAALSAAAACAFFIRRKLAAGAKPLQIVRGVASFWGLALCAAVLVVSGYLCLAFASGGFIPGAVLAGFLCLALSGYLFFGRKHKR